MRPVTFTAPVVSVGFSGATAPPYSATPTQTVAPQFGAKKLTLLGFFLSAFCFLGVAPLGFGQKTTPATAKHVNQAPPAHPQAYVNALNSILDNPELVDYHYKGLLKTIFMASADQQLTAMRGALLGNQKLARDVYPYFYNTALNLKTSRYIAQDEFNGLITAYKTFLP